MTTKHQTVETGHSLVARDHLHLAPATIRRYLSAMTDTKPPGPFTLTRPRIVLLVLGAIAVTYIVGALMGGVSNYNDLRNARDAASSEAAAASSQP